MTIVVAIVLYAVLFVLSQAMARQMGYPVGKCRPTLPGLVLPVIIFLGIWLWVSIFFWGVAS